MYFEIIEKYRKKARVFDKEIECQIFNNHEYGNISFTKCHVILEIGYNKRITIKKLSEILNYDKSTIGRIIYNLEFLGLVKRLINPDDKRYIDVELTDEGYMFFEKINDLCNKRYIEVFNFIPMEKHEIIIQGVSLFASAILQYRNLNKN